MRDLHQEFAHWKVWPAEKVEEHLVDGASLVGPSIHMAGKNINPQLYTVIGAHPIDVGFAYFTGGTTPPGIEMPRLDYERKKSTLPNSLKYGETPYAVFTTGATTPSRTVLGRHLNPIIAYTKSLGITPVFLGKVNFVGDGKNTVSWPKDIDYSQGLDLRNQTSVKDAACIMQHAAFTAGLDCGLLHLASLMSESRVIFGYNITSVEHRVPRRTHGRTINMSVSAEELPCTGCQSRWRQCHTHRFDQCFYQDVKCVDLLFETKKWTDAIDEVLK